MNYGKYIEMMGDFFKRIRDNLSSNNVEENIVEIEDLYNRITSKLNSNNVENSNEEISAFKLKDYLINGMTKYNEYMGKNVSILKNSLNKNIRRYNIFKRNLELPYISNICPGIDSEGNNYIELFFMNYYGRFVGKAIIDDNLAIQIKELYDSYSKEELKKFLIDNDYISQFELFMDKLEEFKSEYPCFSFQWYNKDKNNNYCVDEGLVKVYYYLDNLERTNVSLANINDIEFAKFHSKNYGCLIDYIDFYSDAFMRKTVVNIDDLNPLYKAIVQKQMKMNNNMNAIKVLKK